MFFLKTKCFKSDSQQERKIKQKYNTNDKVQIIREKTKTKVQQEMNLNSKGHHIKMANLMTSQMFVVKISSCQKQSFWKQLGITYVI